MISYVENYDANDSAALHEAYAYAAGLSTCVLVWAVLHHLYFFHMQRVGMRLRVAVCHMIYRKVSVTRECVPPLKGQGHLGKVLCKHFSLVYRDHLGSFVLYWRRLIFAPSQVFFWLLFQYIIKSFLLRLDQGYIL